LPYADPLDHGRTNERTRKAGRRSPVATDKRGAATPNVARRYRKRAGNEASRRGRAASATGRPRDRGELLLRGDVWTSHPRRPPAERHRPCGGVSEQSGGMSPTHRRSPVDRPYPRTYVCVRRPTCPPTRPLQTLVGGGRCFAWFAAPGRPNLARIDHSTLLLVLVLCISTVPSVLPAPASGKPASMTDA
jgi:hypothetical protein